MNVIFNALRSQLELPYYRLFDIGFQGLIMKTTDHKNTLLDYWTKFIIIVKKIFRLIKCFEASRISIFKSVISRHFSLLLRFPWLFNVNVILSVRDFKISISNSAQKKIMKEIVEFEIMFCIEHTLLLYPRQALFKGFDSVNSNQKSNDENEFSSNDFSANNLSDIENGHF